MSQPKKARLSCILVLEKAIKGAAPYANRLGLRGFAACKVKTLRLLHAYIATFLRIHKICKKVGLDAFTDLGDYDTIAQKIRTW